MLPVIRQTTTRSAQRAFSTEAKVHPNILPFLQAPRRSSAAARWAAPVAALVAAGYAANSYRVSRQAAMAEEAERRAHESRELASKLLDAYGDGESIDALENAVAVYEAHNSSSGRR